MCELKLDELQVKIMRDLDLGLILVPNKFDVERDEFHEVVKRLESFGLLTYDEETHPYFKGDVKNVKITEKGKEVFKEYK